MSETEDISMDISGLPVNVNTVSIEGHKHTSSKFIFSEINTVGKAKNFGELNDNIYNSIESLKSTNIFNDVTAVVDSPIDGTHESAVDMNVAFMLKEKSRLGFSFGINQATDSGTTQGSISGHLRNLIGHGDTLDVSYGSTDLKLNGSNKAISATLRDIRPFSNSKSTAYIGVASDTQDQAILSSFLNHVSSIRVGVTSQSKKHSVEYNFSHRQLTPIVPKLGTIGQAATSEIVNETLIPTNKSSIKYTYRHDTRRDNVLLPTEGTLVNTSVEFAGLPGSDVSFAKAECTSQYFVPITQSLTFSVTGRGGIVTPLGSGKLQRYEAASKNPDTALISGNAKIPEVPSVNIVDRFTQHTMFVRGYSPADIGPKSGEDVLGGDCYLSAGMYITGIFPYADTNIKPHVFYNTGSLSSLANWMKEKREKGDGCRKCPVENSMDTIGAGIVIPTVLGRLELNVVSAIKNGQVSKPKFSLVAGMDY